MLLFVCFIPAIGAFGVGSVYNLRCGDVLIVRSIDDFMHDTERGSSDMNYDVIVNWDTEAGVWCAVCDNIPLALESNSFDALITRVKIAANEILELNGKVVENTRLCFITAHKERIA